ncbi:hypothetical protein QYF36_020268 [Acer negundo]|nr:hypothetical protein QYF36_020268 [Acer negundo]
MGADEIAKLCSTLSLKGKKGPVWRLQDDLKVNGAKKLTHCLVGRIMSPNLVNRVAFRYVIAKIWKVHDGAEIEVIYNNIYAFHFQSMDDMRKVLKF